MSEYWKSTPKYWCKHCSAYVKDTPFERKQHESTGKHQGNLKRFLRSIQNEHEKGERDKERAKAEVDRLNKVVGGTASSAGPSNSKANTIRKPATTALTAVDQKRQWAQLAEMGISVPENFRAEMAMPGQWQTMSSADEEVIRPEDTLSKGIRKRKVEDQDEDEEEQPDVGASKERRGWGATTRRYPGQEDADLDVLLSQTITKVKGDQIDIKRDPELEAVSKIDATPTLEQPKMNSTQLGDATKITDQTDVDSGINDRMGTKTEHRGPEGTPPLSDVQQAMAAPVFKKRRIKSKVERGME